jgi:hypothetical protein
VLSSNYLLLVPCNLISSRLLETGESTTNIRVLLRSDDLVPSFVDPFVLLCLFVHFTVYTTSQVDKLVAGFGVTIFVNLVFTCGLLILLR